ncbi:MAG: hypothetical protein ABW170_23510 [Candidatus Thiodiazotropha sp. L084R]
MKNRNGICLSLITLLLSVGCSAKNPEHSADQIDSGKDEGSNMPNVSIQHCLDDGYEILKVTQDGIPKNYLCINPVTNKKCETWAYYRGSCQLADTETQKPPEHGITIKAK